MKGGVLVYKCRRCGGLEQSTHAPDALTALACILTDGRTPRSWGGGAATMTTLHSCKDRPGATGVADLIGGIEDE